MPIYAYRCDACGFQKDVLQKLSEPALTRCPSCEAESFVKQLSAPAFQLKGTGWYVTDFRDNGKKADGKTDTRTAGDGAASGGSAGTEKAAPAKSETAASGSEGTAAAPSSTPAPAASKAGSSAGASAETA